MDPDSSRRRPAAFPFRPQPGELTAARIRSRLMDRTFTRLASPAISGVDIHSQLTRGDLDIADLVKQDEELFALL